MPRLARCVLVAALGVASPAAAQPVAPLLDDADACRAALGDVLYANVGITAGAVSSPARIAADVTGITVEFPDGTTRRITPDDASAAVEWRLLAAAMSRGDLDESLAPFGDVAAMTTDSWTVDDSADAVTGFAVELGTDVFGITLELGTGRLREVVAVVDGVRWRLETTTPGQFGNGWFFGNLRVLRDGIETVSVDITDLAPRRDDLAPLPLAAATNAEAPAPESRVVVPWLPL